MVYLERTDRGISESVIDNFKVIGCHKCDGKLLAVGLPYWYLMTNEDFGLDDIDKDVFRDDYSNLVEFMDICAVCFDYYVDEVIEVGNLSYELYGIFGSTFNPRQTRFIIHFLRSYYDL